MAVQSMNTRSKETSDKYVSISTVRYFVDQVFPCEDHHVHSIVRNIVFHAWNLHDVYRGFQCIDKSNFCHIMWMIWHDFIYYASSANIQPPNSPLYERVPVREVLEIMHRDMWSILTFERFKWVLYKGMIHHRIPEEELLQVNKEGYN